jgi:DNA polymerase III subunit delta
VTPLRRAAARAPRAAPPPSRGLDSRPVSSSFRPAYLIHGDDHGRIGERRANLRRMAEGAAGAGGVELLDADAATPELVAAGLNTMTFAMGHRFLIVDGAERFKDADVKAALVPALAAMPPDTTVAFFAREEGRAKVPPSLAAAVKACGGVVAVEQTLKARELPRWIVQEAAKLGLELDGGAARVLVEHVGERQQRLLRELEKLALEWGPGTRLGVEEVEAVAAPSAEHQVWGFIDALVSRDRAAAVRAYLELRAQGEALPRLIPLMAKRLREVHAIAARLEAGESAAALKATLKMSPYAADRRIKDARGSDADALRRAIVALADLELASRGLADVTEDTAALRAIDAIAA